MRPTANSSARVNRTILLLQLSMGTMLGCSSSSDDDTVEAVRDDPTEPAEEALLRDLFEDLRHLATRSESAKSWRYRVENLRFTSSGTDGEAATVTSESTLIAGPGDAYFTSGRRRVVVGDDRVIAELDADGGDPAAFAWTVTTNGTTSTSIVRRNDVYRLPCRPTPAADEIFPLECVSRSVSTSS